jgi:hypothetical protein
MKGAILFCDYLLLQRTWLLGLFLTPQKVPFGSLAPLLRFGSLQWLGYQEPVFPRFSLPGTVHSCAFSSLQWFALPYTSRVYFTPIHSWDFPSELSPLRDRFLLPKLFYSSSKTHALLPLVALRTGYAVAMLPRVITTALQFGFRAFFPLKARSHQARD